MSEEKWCKIIETEEHGDVLIQKSQSEDGGLLAVKTTFQCDMGEISIAITIKDSDTDEEDQHNLYSKMDKDSCPGYVESVKKDMGLK